MGTFHHFHWPFYGWSKSGSMLCRIALWDCLVEAMAVLFLANTKLYRKLG